MRSEKAQSRCLDIDGLEIQQFLDQHTMMVVRQQQHIPKRATNMVLPELARRLVCLKMVSLGSCWKTSVSMKEIAQQQSWQQHVSASFVTTISLAVAARNSRPEFLSLQEDECMDNIWLRLKLDIPYIKINYSRILGGHDTFIHIHTHSYTFINMSPRKSPNIGLRMAPMRC